MWLVHPATMTRRTERLSRLLRLWLTTMPSDFTTMPSDFTTFPRLLRLSPERLCDFPARVSDFDRAADLPTRSAAFPFPGLIVSAWGAAGPPGALPVRVFAQFTKNLDFLLCLRLTSKCKYDKLQLPKASKRKFDL